MSALVSLGFDLFGLWALVFGGYMLFGVIAMLWAAWTDKD